MQAWLRERARGVTASNVHIVAGLSAYKSPQQYYQELLFKRLKPQRRCNRRTTQRKQEEEEEERDIQDQNQNQDRSKSRSQSRDTPTPRGRRATPQHSATIDSQKEPLDHGHTLEPFVRDFFGQLLGVQIREAPLCWKRDGAPFGATPDGVFACPDKPGEWALVEIKCPLRRNYKDVIPLAYMAQMQCQMEIVGAPYCEFVVYYWQTGKVHSWTVFRSKTYWAWLERRLRTFWRALQRAEGPPSEEALPVIYHEAIQLQKNKWMYDASSHRLPRPALPPRVFVRSREPAQLALGAWQWLSAGSPPAQLSDPRPAIRPIRCQAWKTSSPARRAGSMAEQDSFRRSQKRTWASPHRQRRRRRQRSIRLAKSILAKH